MWPRTSNFLKLSIFCILWIFHTRPVFYINFAILYKSYYKWEKDDLSERLRAWREIIWKAFVMIKHCPNMLVYLCPSFCQKGRKGAHRDTWNITWVTKVKRGGKKRKKNKGGGLRGGWNEAGQSRHWPPAHRATHQGPQTGTWAFQQLPTQMSALPEALQNLLPPLPTFPLP